MTQEELKAILHYDPLTGVFTRLKAVPKTPVGGVAGTLDHKGYIQISIKFKKCAAHRLAWLYVYGYIPEKQIDHINGIRNDNRIENLREATPQENLRNAALRSDNTSGIKGVSWSKGSSMWVANASLNGKSHYLGQFHNIDLAEIAYKEFAQEHHKEFFKNQ